MKPDACRLLVLVSGNGSNLQALIDAERRADWPAKVVAVISDRPEVFALERARLAGIDCWVEKPDLSLPKAERRAELSKRIDARARALAVELIVMAGFLSILEGSILENFQGRILNIHPSLLPKYGGSGLYGERVHAAVLAAGESESGCSVHLVEAGIDSGPVLVQRRVPVFTDDTVASLAERIHPEEHFALTMAVSRLAKQLNQRKPRPVRPIKPV